MPQNLNGNQTKYLETLLQTSSIETLSTGLCSVLLHSGGLASDELLTASLIYLALSIEPLEGTGTLSSVKKSAIAEAVGTFTHLSNALRGLYSTLDEDGNEVMVEDGAVLDGLFPPEAPSLT